MAEDDEDWSGSRLEETKRVARIVEIATLLAAQPRRWTRARLAARYERCERQIARDLEVLRYGLGYHIDRTRDGYVIQGAPIVPRLTLTMPEVLALALAAGLARDSGDVDTVTLGAAIAKLEALVPPDTLSLLRRELARGRSNSTAARRSETLALLERAWLERRRVRMAHPPY
jgi:predicted DNA-binding transcriptional regulator YafY